VVRAEAVSKSYRNPTETVVVFEALDLELYPGEITCLIGPSGCGKSTIISLLAGLTDPDSGRVLLHGQDIGKLSDTERAQLRATRIGIVLQSSNLVPFLTAAENIAIAMRLAGAKSSPGRVNALLEQVGLADRGRHLPRRLSGGEMQRVGLAIALANSPDLLLADELVGQLDSATAASMMASLERSCIEAGLAVLLVTHNLEIAGMGSRVLRLVDGTVETV
jgi:putative ABC transport system ATP-binding protein